MNWSRLGVFVLGLVAVLPACTHKVQVEPSDKPFIVNLNVKVDHEIRMKIEEQNQDLLNLEESVKGKTKPKKG
ncbi:MAG: YnbE family lipoprotein [Proteobacteria bacterium]|nr:YnbE family lipoprotein [Pseudomonadota bacterium]NDC25429.1 YnbE family lipoprotein [Pseudomonadota bacterium]NDD05763.1 YnbE family lipoprotein [Pseudomonadota bacterium]NDG27721.1 YnbE family lipoprotein [Pseudomonadota bacterium]